MKQNRKPRHKHMLIWLTTLFSISIDLPVQDMAPKWTHMICGLSWLTFFTYIILSRFVHIGAGMFLHYIPVLYSLELYILHSSVHSLVDRNLSCFHFGLLYNVYKFFYSHMGPFSWAYISMELPSYRVTLSLEFWVISKMISRTGGGEGE